VRVSDTLPPVKRGTRNDGARRIAALALVAALLLPSIASAAPRSWTYWPKRVGNITFDVAIARPAAAIALAAGGVLFLPAAVFSAANGRDTLEEGYERFILGPGEQLWGRPLGEL
jgi:hypothetical protein